MALDQLIAEALNDSVRAIEEMKVSTDPASIAYLTSVAQHHQTKALAISNHKIVEALGRIEGAITAKSK
jgi:hypothetical protein